MGAMTVGAVEEERAPPEQAAARWHATKRPQRCRKVVSLSDCRERKLQRPGHGHVGWYPGWVGCLGEYDSRPGQSDTEQAQGPDRTDSSSVVPHRVERQSGEIEI